MMLGCNGMRCKWLGSPRNVILEIGIAQLGQQGLGWVFDVSTVRLTPGITAFPGHHFTAEYHGPTKPRPVEPDFHPRP